MAYDYGDIRMKVRKLTGRLSSDQMSDNELNNFINNYIHYTFAAEFKLDTNLVPYKFLTVKGQEYYPLPENFTNFVPPVYINGLDFPYYTNPGWSTGFGLNYYLTPSLYYQSIGQYYNRKVLAVGDGVTINFNQGAQNYPILSGSTIVTDNIETFTDDGTGILTGSLGGNGTVDYEDGSISVSFTTAPPLNTQIWLSYLTYQSGQPQIILNYNGNFRLYPVPDNVYQIELAGYQMPDVLVNADDTPKLQEWGPVIAYGAARDIFADYGELDRYAEMTALYKEQVKYVNRRDIQNTMYRSAIRSS